jgi:SSS family solute:Na+ symporter
MTAAPLLDTRGSLYERLQQINATFFGPMLAVILLGLFTRWATPLAAKLALVLGPLLFFAVVFAWNEPVQVFLRSSLGLQGDIHFLHFLAAVFVATVVGMAAISFAAPRKCELKPPASDAVDMRPWRHAKSVGLLLVLATLGCYWALAR